MPVYNYDEPLEIKKTNYKCHKHGSIVGKTVSIIKGAKERKDFCLPCMVEHWEALGITAISF